MIVLSLTSEILCNAIISVAGPPVIAEYNAQKANKSPAFFTSNGALPCQRILFLTVPMDTANITEFQSSLRTFVRTAMDLAAKHKFRSLGKSFDVAFLETFHSLNFFSVSKYRLWENRCRCEHSSEVDDRRSESATGNQRFHVGRLVRVGFKSAERLQRVHRSPEISAKLSGQCTNCDADTNDQTFNGGHEIRFLRRKKYTFTTGDAFDRNENYFQL